MAIALDNGARVVSVENMTDAEVKLVLEHLEAGWGDEEIREGVHLGQIGEWSDERSFVAAYATEHQSRLGEIFTLP